MRGWYIVAGIAALIFAATAAAITISLSGRHQQHTDLGVGECVSLSPDASGELMPTHTSCATDMSFTIGALADDVGNCVPDQFDRFRAPFADAATERLCLVPNLTVGHCYRLGVPVGMLDPADCSVGGPAVFRVTKRVEVLQRSCLPGREIQVCDGLSGPHILHGDSRMTRRLIAAAVTVGMLATGCVTTVNGTPRMVGSSGGIVGIGREIPQILPDRDDLVAALGTPVDNNGFPPSVGDLDVLPDGIRDSSDASEIQCLTVTFPYSKKVFEKSAVRAVATQDWDNWGQGLSVPGFSVRAGALALASPADARALFAKLTSQWQQCQGKTMVLYKPGGSPADHLLDITDVRTTDTIG